MPANVCLGKNPAIRDVRVPRFGAHAAGLPPPPAAANWYADVPEWGMLANDSIGCCVEAAVLHMILQMTSYVSPGHAPLPTEAEAVAFYSAATGYVPGNISTDQGSYVLGHGGVMEYWATTGVMCGGVLNRPTAFLQLRAKDPVHWQQAVATFGSLAIGIQLPESIVSGDDVPFVWDNPLGPSAGGHEVLLVGYQPTRDGILWDLVSWGTLYRTTTAFLMATLDEAVCVYDKAFMNALGTNPAGVDEATLVASMESLRSEG